MPDAVSPQHKLLETEVPWSGRGKPLEVSPDSPVTHRGILLPRTSAVRTSRNAADGNSRLERHLPSLSRGGACDFGQIV